MAVPPAPSWARVQIATNGLFAINRSDTSSSPQPDLRRARVRATGTGTTISDRHRHYIGGTTISQGTLQLGNGGTTGSIVGDVTNNGVFAINRSGHLHLRWHRLGQRRLRPDRQRRYHPDRDQHLHRRHQHHRRHAVQLGNGGTAGSIAGDVTNNGIFAVNRLDTFTFGGTISGSGALAQRGTGTTILTGANTYAGGTTPRGRHAVGIIRRQSRRGLGRPHLQRWHPARNRHQLHRHVADD